MDKCAPSKTSFFLTNKNIFYMVAGGRRPPYKGLLPPASISQKLIWKICTPPLKNKLFHLKRDKYGATPLLNIWDIFWGNLGICCEFSVFLGANWGIWLPLRQFKNWYGPTPLLNIWDNFWGNWGIYCEFSVGEQIWASGFL